MSAGFPLAVRITFSCWAQYSVTGKIGDLHIYRGTAGGLAYVSTYQPEYLGGKIICHSGGLYIVERPFPGGERPRYLDNIMIHRLIPEGGQDAVIEAVPESFMWQKIYDNRAAYAGDVTGYLEEIKTDLADLSYRSNDEDVYTGDEDPEIELNQFLRLGSVVSPCDQPFIKLILIMTGRTSIFQKKRVTTIYMQAYTSLPAGAS